MKSRRSTIVELENDVPISAIEALRRNLLYAMLNGVCASDMEKIVEAQVSKAKQGDTKSAKLVIDMVSAGSARQPTRDTFIQQEGGIVDYKVEIRKLIACLIAFNGPQSTEEVASRLHLTGMVAIDSLMCGWFSKEGGKWTITNEARTRVIDVHARLAASEDSSDDGDEEIK